MTQITEHTTAADRARGFRNITVARESHGSLCITSICAVRSEDLSHDGDAPLYISTGNVEPNVELAALLISLAADLLAYPHSVQLPALSQPGTKNQEQGTAPREQPFAQ